MSVVLTEPVALFELSTMVEVFGLDRTADGIESFDLRLCAADPSRPLRTKSVPVTQVFATHGLHEVADSDLVIASATPVHADFDAAAIAAVRAAWARGAIVMSVCSGAFLLGAAGLLDTHRATTHWMYADQLQRAFPRAVIDPDVLYVDDGRLITSAGTAAGIDAALHLVRRELGARAAQIISRRMVVSAHRDGSQCQLVGRDELPESVADLQRVQSWVLDHLDEPHTVASLAARLHHSERSFSRRFRSATGTSPHRWLTQQRVLRAQRLLESDVLSVQEVAVRVGFASASVFRDRFRRQVGMAPMEYRRRFAEPAPVLRTA